MNNQTFTSTSKFEISPNFVDSFKIVMILLKTLVYYNEKNNNLPEKYPDINATDIMLNIISNRNIIRRED